MARSVGVVLKDMAGLLDELAGTAPGELTDAELSEAVVDMQVLTDRLDGLRAGVLGAWDARSCWSADRARTGAAWLAWRCRVPKGTARRQIRLARAVRQQPAAAAAWQEGRIGADHVAALARTRAANPDRYRADEDELVVAASEQRFDKFQQRLSYWRHRHAPERAERDAESKRQQRSLHLSESFEGMWFGDLVLDPVSGTIVAGALGRIEAELFAADWREARERLGDAATANDLVRTPAQRRADALVEMAVRAATAPAGGRRPAPLFTAFVGYETFAGPLCELAQGTPVTPGALLPWLEGADVERAVFDGPSRVIDIGERRRLFTGGLRRAIELRDRECFEAACDERADHSQVDHIDPWGRGGPTTQPNGRIACAFHNRLRNRTTPPSAHEDDGDPP